MDDVEELGDDLVHRRATVADTDALVAFNAGIHRKPGEDATAFVASWTRNLMSGRPRRAVVRSTGWGRPGPRPKARRSCSTMHTCQPYARLAARRATTPQEGQPHARLRLAGPALQTRRGRHIGRL